MCDEVHNSFTSPFLASKDRTRYVYVNVYAQCPRKYVMFSVAMPQRQRLAKGVRIAMAGWLHGVFVVDWLFVFPLCGFSLSLFCNY